MEILAGLFSGMVLQRNKKNVCDVTIQGRTNACGPVALSVSKGAKKLAGFNDRVVGQAAQGSLKAKLQGLPVGGPYRIELRVADAKSGKPDSYVASDVLVGDVWIAGGQSNMQGIGLLSGAEKPHPMVRAFYMDDHWAVARDPIHQLYLAVDDFHRLEAGNPPPKNHPVGTGPAISFAQARHKATGVPQGILASGHGGTSLLQWDPDKKAMGGKSLYGAMYRRFVKNGSAVAGMIWYQGENETNPQDYAHFTVRMKKLIAASRRDLKFPDMPWVMVQLGRTVGSVGDANQWNDIQEQQRNLPKVIKNISVVPAIDLTLDDQIHISGLGCRTLGRRMAQAMGGLLDGQAAGGVIEVKSVQVRPVPGREQCEIVVDFANVQGKLQCPGRPTGFSVTDAKGQSDILFEVELSGHQAVLRCFVPARMLVGDRFLRYGAGFNPVCQITDQAGRSLPVFGPLRVGKPRAVTGYTTLCQVSDIQPSAGKLHELVYPQDQSRMNWTVRRFMPNFTHRHEELMALAPKDVLVWYRLPLKLSQPMTLKALMGYDGPIKVFLDGREVFFDPNGVNPAIVDHVAVALGKLAAGEHEVLVAMGSNGGLAWGTFLRFERTDLSAKQIIQGLTGEQLPQINL